MYRGPVSYGSSTVQYHTHSFPKCGTMYNNYVNNYKSAGDRGKMTTVAKHGIRFFKEGIIQDSNRIYTLIVFIMIERCPRLPTHTHTHMYTCLSAVVNYILFSCRSSSFLMISFWQPNILRIVIIHNFSSVPVEKKKDDLQQQERKYGEVDRIEESTTFCIISMDSFLPFVYKRIVKKKITSFLLS